MKTAVVKFVAFLIVFAVIAPQDASSQDISGIWRGYFVTNEGDNYKLEFQVDQNQASVVKGVSYSYLDVRFYGKATMTGKFTKTEKKFVIQEIRTVEVRNLGGGVTCLMKYTFTYSRSGKEEFLEGTYVGKFENPENPKAGKWGDCGGGKVFLRKVTTSEFYIEPFVRKKTTEPPKERNTTTATAPRKKVTPPTPRVPKPDPVIASVDTTSKKKTDAIVIERPPEKPKILPPPVSTRARKNELAETVIVHNRQVTVKLYDNGEIDDDTISVYLDGRLILANKKLSATPITYTLEIDEDHPEHTLVMVAENLGRIPPNTSLMIVQDGDKRYQVAITSTEQKNAMVRFRYESRGN